MEKAGAAEGGDLGGWPLVSSATVLSLKGIGTFKLKGELLGLGIHGMPSAWETL